MKTRSAYFRAPWQVELRQIELPDQIPAGRVLVRVEACGICGSDLHALQEQDTEWQPFGHEIAGIVEKSSAGSEQFKPGTRVALESTSYCGQCEACRNGRVELCHQGPNLWGIPSQGFSDFLLAPVASLVPYEGLSPDVACLLEPAGVAYDIIETARIRLGDSVAVVGPGAIALMTVVLALRAGAGRVLCIGRPGNEKRLELARKLGAETLIADKPLDRLDKERQQFEHVLMTASVKLIPAALSLLKFGGELTYIGFGGEGGINLDAHDFHLRKLQLRAGFASPGIYFPVLIKLLKAGILPGELFISHRFELAEIGKAVELCRTDKGSTVKVVIKPGIR